LIIQHYPQRLMAHQQQKTFCRGPYMIVLSQYRLVIGLCLRLE
jgi:hypothetical protein